MDDPPNADPALHRLLNAQLARPSEEEAILTEDLDTDPPAHGDLSNAERAFQRLHFDFGDKPFIVLSGTNEQNQLPLAQRAKVNQAMLANQAALAVHSTRGKQVLVNTTSEYIQTNHPAVVVRAVTEVVRDVREQTASRNTSLNAQK